MKLSITDFISLTKPTVLVLVLITGATALVVYGGIDWVDFILVIAGLYGVGACANTLNQYFERDIDAKMARTKLKRPLASGKMKPQYALYFAFLMATIGIGIFSVYFNLLSAMLGLGTIVFYSFFYTLYLKPRTPQNIVIGGAAGAMGPMIAWAAVAGDLASVVPWVLFFLIFFWTPPHFWALALYLKDDYKAVNYPMMPNIKGDDATYKLIVRYTFVMVVVSYGLILYQPVGGVSTNPLNLFYLIGTTVLGGIFIQKALQMLREKSIKFQKSMFAYSIIYIFLMCFMIMIDAVN
ncbi:MAG: heme o synthase [Calditrichaeota bacterium]|nr:heme o synthase [Calditrichota bacterium]